MPYSVTHLELRRLVSAMSPETFVERYWQKRSVLLPGPPERLPALIDRERIFEVLHQGVDKRLRVRAGQEARPINRRDARELFESGQGLCIDHLETEVAELAAYALALQAQLNFPGVVNVASYLSPDGAGFSHIHMDSRIALTLQIEGTKRWRYASEPAVPWPVNQPYLSDDGRPMWPGHARPWELAARHGPVKTTSAVLTPGDALCIPAGTWHSAEATGGTSLSLRIGFETPSVIRLLTQVLTQHFEAHPAWREIPGAWQDRDDDARADIPASVAEHLEQRLEELRGFLATLTVDALPVKRAWRRALCTAAAVETVEAQRRRADRIPPDRGGPEDTARAATPAAKTPDDAKGSIAPDDRLALADDLPVLYSVEPGDPDHRSTKGDHDDDHDGDHDDETVVLIHGRTEIALSGEGLEEFFAQLLRTRRFVARDATGWVADDEEFEWQDVQPVLELLLDRGVIHRRPDSLADESADESAGKSTPGQRDDPPDR